jgi:hypothetical protein
MIPRALMILGKGPVSAATVIDRHEQLQPTFTIYPRGIVRERARVIDERTRKWLRFMNRHDGGVLGI